MGFCTKIQYFNEPFKFSGLVGSRSSYMVFISSMLAIWVDVKVCTEIEVVRTLQWVKWFCFKCFHFYLAEWKEWVQKRGKRMDNIIPVWGFLDCNFTIKGGVGGRRIRCEVSLFSLAVRLLLVTLSVLLVTWNMKSLLHFWCGGDTTVCTYIFYCTISLEKRDWLNCVVVMWWRRQRWSWMGEMKRRLKKGEKEKVDRSLFFTSKAEWLTKPEVWYLLFLKREKSWKRNSILSLNDLSSFLSFFLQLPCRFLSVVQVLEIHCPTGTTTTITREVDTMS